jgi:hypothetical protein
MGWMDDVGGYKGPVTTEPASNGVDTSFMSDVSDKPPSSAPVIEPQKLKTKPADYVDVPWFSDPTTEGSPSTKDTTVFARAGENLLPNTQKVWADTLHALTHPYETAKGARDIVSGGVTAGMESLGLKPGFGVSTPNQKTREQLNKEKEMFQSAVEPYKQWFSEPGAFKRDVAETPAEVAMSASLPATGVEKALALSGLKGPAKVAGIVSKANPIGAPLELTSGVLEHAAFPLWGKLGTGYGVQGSAMGPAYTAGREGSTKYLGAFLNPLSSGDQAIYDLAQKAKDKLYKNRQADWMENQKNLADISEAKNRVDYNPLIGRISEEVQSRYNPRTGANNFTPEQLKLVDEMANHIYERSLRDPAQFDLAHTAMDLDAYKRIFTDAFEDRARNTNMSHVYNDIRGKMIDQIKERAPKYSDDMALYGAQTDEINNILKQFKLGSRASKDDAIDRLMARPNEQKQRLIDVLAQHEPELPNVIAGRKLKLFQYPDFNRLPFVLGGPLNWAGLPLMVPGVAGGAPYAAGLGMAGAQRYGLPSFYEAHQAQERQGRASGGKVDHKSAEAISDQLVAAFANAKKNEDLESKVLLNKPDDVIIDALKEAKKAI